MNSILWTLDAFDAFYAEAFPAQLHSCEITDLDLELLSWINVGNSSPEHSPRSFI